MMLSTKRLASVAIFTALVFVCTIAFNFSIPATNGYFNIGEVMVYTTALIMGPYVGAVAGGLGSALSDEILAPQYAPGTLVIKAAEGFIVGLLGTKVLVNMSRKAWKLTSVACGALTAAGVGYVGRSYLTGTYLFSLGFNVGPQANLSFDIPEFFWYVAAVITFVAIFLASLSVSERVGWTVISIIAGGLEMVLGYFFYESIGLQLGYASALAEVPYNIGQVIVGLLIAVPLSAAVKRMLRGLSTPGTPETRKASS
jgi:uncharacterized membrane protein